MSRVAAVVIGRNEGPRLPRCLHSLAGSFAPIVYVDSESTDGSPETARALGVDVVALDLSIPFTFGRGRNTGAARVLELAPDVDFIQFVDADSEIVSSWRESALAHLQQQPQVAVVWGRVHERDPGSSIYDRLYEIEFDPRTEEPGVFGGMSMIRVDAYQQVGRFNEILRGFEDHELGFRLQGAGWQLQRLEADMAIHEGGMTHFREWWGRELRAGHSRAQQIAMHGSNARDAWWRAYASICFWGLALPVSALTAAWPTRGASLLLFGGYSVLGYRVYRRLRRHGLTPADAALYAAGRVVGKFPQLHGVILFHRDAVRGVRRGSV